MYIYNVTTKVADSIHAAWLSWMKETHIPAVMATKCFTSFRIVRILDIDDSEGPTYAIQYECETKVAYDHYINHESDLLRKAVMDQWGHQTIAFRSFMEIVN